MDPDAIARYIVETFPGVEAAHASGDVFFMYDPDQTLPPERRLPFATLVTGDRYDQASNLDRPDVFRLNMGVSPATFRRLVGAGPAVGAADTGAPRYDPTALDTIMPHPVYGKMFWVCVLNPSPETFATVRTLLAEAYDRAVERHAKARRTKHAGSAADSPWSS
jgi:uncharacterized protein DUF6194